MRGISCVGNKVFFFVNHEYWLSFCFPVFCSVIVSYFDTFIDLQEASYNMSIRFCVFLTLHLVLSVWLYVLVYTWQCSVVVIVCVVKNSSTFSDVACCDVDPLFLTPFQNVCCVVMLHEPNQTQKCLTHSYPPLKWRTQIHRTLKCQILTQ